jgi:hypothetical protein
MRALYIWFVRLILYPIGSLILLVILFFAVVDIVTTPSNDRDWSPDQAVLPFAEIENNLISVHNVRNYTYASTTSYIQNYYDKVYDLNKIKKVWYIVEPFSGFAGSAHTFLSFEFENNEFVSISVEIRKEKGEKFSAVKGLLNRYELMYVIADEKDVVKLRSNYRKDKVYVYPVRTTPEKARALFVDMVNKANWLKAKPEFYNSLWNNCTVVIARHVNAISPKRLPIFSLEFILPAKSDQLAYDLGLIDTDLSFEKAREKFLINERALKYADSPDFSQKIRQED